MWIARLTATSPHFHSPAKRQIFFIWISTSKPIAQTQTSIGMDYLCFTEQQTMSNTARSGVSVEANAG
jgi:hypothetical protein